MKVALPIRNGRISPVFDVATRIAVVEIESGVSGECSEYSIRESGSEARAELLQELGVTTLICGAISNPAARIIERCGISLMPWVVGEVGDVIEAYCTGSLDNEGFIMPGCRRGHGGGRGNRQERRLNYRGGGRRNRE